MRAITAAASALGKAGATLILSTGEEAAPAPAGPEVVEDAGP